RVRPRTRGVGTPDHCRRPGYQNSSPDGCGRSPNTRCASPDAPDPTVSPRTAHRDAGPATAGRPAGVPCPRGPVTPAFSERGGHLVVVISRLVTEIRRRTVPVVHVGEAVHFRIDAVRVAAVK